MKNASDMHFYFFHKTKQPFFRISVVYIMSRIKILTLWIICFFSPRILFSQWTADYSNDSIVLMQNTSEYVPATLQNDFTQDIELDIIRVQNNLPSGWVSGLCVDVCQTTIVDSIRITVPAGQSKEFKMYFALIIPELPPDTAHTEILFRNVDSQKKVSLDFYAMLLATGIYESNTENPIKIYPNPVLCSQNIKISGFFNETIFIYDITGRIVMETILINENLFISPEIFSSGIYFITGSERKNAVKLIVN